MVTFTKEELDAIYTQMAARKQNFNDMMVSAAKENNVKRIIECVKYIDIMQSVLNKCLDMLSEVKK